jgi:hypothetical protein
LKSPVPDKIILGGGDVIHSKGNVSLEVVKIAEADETRRTIGATASRLRELTRQRLPEAMARFIAA